MAADGTVTLARLSRPAAAAGRRSRAAGLPLCDVLLAGAGRIWSGSRYAESAAGRRLRYVTHERAADGGWRQLRVELEDPVTGCGPRSFTGSWPGRGCCAAGSRW